MTIAQLSFRSKDFASLLTSRGIGDEAFLVDGHLERIYSELMTSLTLGESYSSALEELSEVVEEASSPDWDGYGANPVDLLTTLSAVQFLRLLPRELPAPDVAAEPDGEVSFEWYRGPRKRFSISVGSCNQITYAGLFGGNEAHGTEYFLDELPETILGHLCRLFS